MASVTVTFPDKEEEKKVRVNPFNVAENVSKSVIIPVDTNVVSMQPYNNKFSVNPEIIKDGKNFSYVPGSGLVEEPQNILRNPYLIPYGIQANESFLPRMSFTVPQGSFIPMQEYTRPSLMAGSLPPVRSGSIASNPLFVQNFSDDKISKTGAITGIYNAKSNVKYSNVDVLTGKVSSAKSSIAKALNPQSSNFSTMTGGNAHVIPSAKKEEKKQVRAKESNKTLIDLLAKISNGEKVDFSSLYKASLSRNSNDYVQFLSPKFEEKRQEGNKYMIEGNPSSSGSFWKSVKDILKSPYTISKYLYDKVTKDSDVKVGNLSGERTCIHFDGVTFYGDNLKLLNKSFNYTTIKITDKFNLVSTPILANICYNPNAYQGLDVESSDVEFSNSQFILKIFGKASYTDDLYAVKVSENEYISTPTDSSKIIGFLDRLIFGEITPIGVERKFLGRKIDGKDDILFILIKFITCNYYRDYLTTIFFENFNLTKGDCSNLSYGLFIVFITMNIPFKFNYDELEYIAYLYYTLFFNIPLEERYVINSIQMVRVFIIAMANKRVFDTIKPILFKNNTKASYHKASLDEDRYLPRRVFAKILDAASNIQESFVKEVKGLGDSFKVAGNKLFTDPLFVPPSLKIEAPRISLYDPLNPDVTVIDFSYDYENPTPPPVLNALARAKVDSARQQQVVRDRTLSGYNKPVSKDDDEDFKYNEDLSTRDLLDEKSRLLRKIEDDNRKLELARKQLGDLKIPKPGGIEDIKATEDIKDLEAKIKTSSDELLKLEEDIKKAEEVKIVLEEKIEVDIPTLRPLAKVEEDIKKAEDVKIVTDTKIEVDLSEAKDYIEKLRNMIKDLPEVDRPESLPKTKVEVNINKDEEVKIISKAKESAPVKIAPQDRLLDNLINRINELDNENNELESKLISLDFEKIIGYTNEQLPNLEPIIKILKEESTYNSKLTEVIESVKSILRDKVTDNIMASVDRLQTIDNRVIKEDIDNDEIKRLLNGFNTLVELINDTSFRKLIYSDRYNEIKEALKVINTPINIKSPFNNETLKADKRRINDPEITRRAMMFRRHQAMPMFS